MTILILTPTFTLPFYPLIINFQILQQHEYIYSKSPKQIKLNNEFCLSKSLCLDVISGKNVILSLPLWLGLRGSGKNPPSIYIFNATDLYKGIEVSWYIKNLDHDFFFSPLTN